jgi:predicted  nucleic acid-binding Zn-ribbon protein
MGGSSSGGNGGGNKNVPGTPIVPSAPKKKKISLMPIALQAAKAVGEFLEKSARPRNIARRKEFIKKQGLTSDDIRIDDDYLASREGLTELRKIGYTTAGDLGGGSDRNQKSIEQPKVASQMDNTQIKSKMITAKGPTDVEMDQLTEDERLLKIKRRGRKRTTLTNLTEEEKPTLSKRILLS